MGIAAAAVAGTLLGVTVRPASADNYVWDPAGTVTATGTTGGGSWDLTTNDWYNVSAGAVAPWTQTSATAGIHAAVFAGGTDAATDTYNVSLGAALAATNLIFNNSGYVLTAPTATTLTLSPGSGITIAAGKVASIGNNVTVNYNTFNQCEIGGPTTNSNVASGTLNIEAGATVVDSGGRTFAVGGAGTVVNVAGLMATNGASGTSSAAISISQIAGSNVTVNVMSGGNLSSGYTGTTPGIFIGNQGAAVLNVSSGGQVNVISTAVNGILFANAATTVTAATGDILNLNGGTITTPAIGKGTGTAVATLNLNGGTIYANKANTAFLTGLNATNILAGGITFDTNTFNITIAQNLLASTTSAGGGLTKANTGVLTLTGSNTYTGPTTITGGTLALSGTGSINGGGAIVINGAGANFVQLATVASTAPVTLNNGTLDGTGTVGAITVGAGTGGIVAGGNGSAGTLTAASLSFLGAGSTNPFLSGSAPTTVGLNVTGALSTTASPITINPSATGGFTNGTTYDLIGYGSLTGPHNFVYGTGLTARQSAVIGVTSTTGAGFVTLVASGDNPKWTGLDGGNWQVGTTGANRNWKLVTAGTTTDYIEGDQVLFDDTATGTTSLNIAAANVSPTGVTFNNSSASYSIGGSFGIAGTGSLTKSGSAPLTISTSNSYTGGNTLNGGTLQLANASALGASGAPLTVNGGTLDLNGNSPTVGKFSGAGGTVTGSTGASVVTVGGSTAATYAGTIGGGAGTVGLVLTGAGSALTLTGNNTLAGGAQINSGTTLVLTGTNTFTPKTSTLFLHNNATLQLQANAGNTSLVNGVPTSSVLTGFANDGSDNSFQFTDSNNGQATLQLRGSQNVTFADTTFHNGVGNTSLNYDVNNLNNDGTTNVTLSVGSILSYNTTVNVSGNPTYTLNFGGVTNALGQYTTINVNSANLVTGAIGSGGAGSGIGIFAVGGNVTATDSISVTGTITVGAAAGYKVSLNGAIPNGGTGSTFLAKSGAGILLLNGANTYTGITTATAGVLAGTGTITGPVSIAGANISAGSGATTSDSIGTLTTGAQTWTANGSGGFIAKVASGGTSNDQLVMGGLTISGTGVFTVTALSLTPGNTAIPAGTQLVLAVDQTRSDYAAIAAAIASKNLVLSTAPGTVTYSDNGTPTLVAVDTGSAVNLDLIDVVAAPEPASLLLASIAAAPLALGRRRRGDRNLAR